MWIIFFFITCICYYYNQQSMHLKLFQSALIVVLLSLIIKWKIINFNLLFLSTFLSKHGTYFYDRQSPTMMLLLIIIFIKSTAWETMLSFVMINSWSIVRICTKIKCLQQSLKMIKRKQKLFFCSALLLHLYTKKGNDK